MKVLKFPIVFAVMMVVAMLSATLALACEQPPECRDGWHWDSETEECVPDVVPTDGLSPLRVVTQDSLVGGIKWWHKPSNGFVSDKNGAIFTFDQGLLSLLRNDKLVDVTKSDMTLRDEEYDRVCTNWVPMHPDGTVVNGYVNIFPFDRDGGETSTNNCPVGNAASLVALLIQP